LDTSAQVEVNVKNISKNKKSNDDNESDIGTLQTDVATNSQTSSDNENDIIDLKAKEFVEWIDVLTTPVSISSTSGNHTLLSSIELYSELRIVWGLGDGTFKSVDYVYIDTNHIDATVLRNETTELLSYSFKVNSGSGTTINVGNGKQRTITASSPANITDSSTSDLDIFLIQGRK
ncbi:MAG: hypothetical protein GQ557_02195, partial [Mycoplasmataceae bacterium]|nr:hypothetical protein [Mycoplasmataceae bacterium]